MEETLEDLYCRLCADLKPSYALCNMFLNLEKRKEITEKLARFDIDVDFNNMLPKTVCLECIESLGRAYDFITTVDMAQEAFMDYDTSEFGIKTQETKEVISDHDTMDSMDANTENNAPKESIDTTTENEAPMDSMDTTTDNDAPVESTETTTEGFVEFEEYIPEDNTNNQIFLPVSKAVEAECARMNEDKAKLSQPLTIKNLPIPRQRRKPKISKNVDLDVWPDYNWLCAFCLKFYHDPSELKVHAMQYHLTCNPYRCFDCRARGLHMDNFIRHIGKHRPVLSKSCYRCYVKFESPKELRTHTQTHFDSTYSCKGCNTCFLTKEDLSDHITKFYKTAISSSMVAQENESLQCAICDKILGSKLVLNRHLQLHTDRKRTYVCDICNGSFYNGKALKSHYIVHSNKRPYKCEVCKYSFKTKNDLRSHAQIHFGIKPFTCHECGKCFRLSKELSVHSAVHKDLRPYKCSQCNKSFRFKHLVVQHQRMHSGSKPYSCEKCPLKFRNWSNFNKHSKDVHGIDNSKRKHTSQGLYALDPETNEVIYPDMKKVDEWKKKILGDGKRGGKKKMAEKKTETSGTTAEDQDSQESMNSTTTSSTTTS